VPAGTRAINLIAPDMSPSRFLEVYGRPNRLMVPERKGEPNVGQAQHLLVGTTYTSKFSASGGKLAQLLESGASNRQIIEELWQAALTRFPASEEQHELELWLGKQSARREALEDLLWSLVASREFSYNH
jgi:hypothetical protein